jgi:hypothetical protein
MGIRDSTADIDAGLGLAAFSQDILKIEIMGPKVSLPSGEHLSSSGIFFYVVWFSLGSLRE